MEPEIFKLPIANENKVFLLRLAHDADIPVLRRLVNAAYKELADMGLNYTATYQDEEVTRTRIQSGRALVLTESAKILATVLFSEKNYFTNRKTAYVGQLAVQPTYKPSGFGSFLMDYCESMARAEGFEGVQLDTAKPALHLVRWYEKRGYEIVGSIRWEGKTYESYIFEKRFS